MIMHYTSKIENPIILDLGSGSVDETYDIIYLDGNEDTEKDLDVAFKKIKNGGYIIGHNYILNFSKTYNKKDFTVKKIVEKFCEENGQRILAQAMDARVSYCIKITKH
jgi:predicted O-methyltransferase YrrM